MDIEKAQTIGKTYSHSKDCIAHRFLNGDVQILKMGFGGQIVSQERFTAREWNDLREALSFSEQPEGAQEPEGEGEAVEVAPDENDGQGEAVESESEPEGEGEESAKPSKKKK